MVLDTFCRNLEVLISCGLDRILAQFKPDVFLGVELLCKKAAAATYFKRGGFVVDIPALIGMFFDRTG